MQGFVITEAVFDRDSLVVIGEGDKSPWRLCVDVFLIGIVIDECFARILPDEIFSRPAVSYRFVHRNYRINEYLEGWP